MSTEYDEDDEYSEEPISHIIEQASSGSAKSVKRLLKLYHRAIRAVCSKDDTKDDFIIEESQYIELINKSHECSLTIFNQLGPVSDRDEDSKVKIKAKTFILDTIALLSNRESRLDSLKISLATLRKPQILRWAVAITHVGIQFLKIVFKVLVGSPSYELRLSAFALLKSYLDLVLLPDYNRAQYGRILRNGLVKSNPKELLNTKINTFSVNLYKAYLRSISKGLNPKNWNISRISRNCVVELLLMIPSDNLYSIAFKQIRKIGRQTMEAWKSSNVDLLCNWSYVESITVWSVVIGRSTPKLDELVYPLVTVSTASLKLANNREKYAPFVLFITKELNDLSYNVNKFIPLASHLLLLLDTIFKFTMNTKVISKSEDDADADVTEESDKNDVRYKPELAIFKLSLADISKREDDIIHHAEYLCRIILIQHLTLLAHHPSFPEIVLVIAKHIKKYRSRQWVRKLLAQINESSDVIKKLRRNIDIDKTNINKLIFFKNCNIPLITFCSKEMEVLDSRISKLIETYQS